MLRLCCGRLYSCLFYVVLLLSGMYLHAMPILTEESEQHPSACLNDEKEPKDKASDESVCFEKKWKSPLKIDDLCAVQELLGKASAGGSGIIKQWFNLGLALGLDYNHLCCIKQNSFLSEEEAFTAMLSCWLNQTNMWRFDQHEEREPSLYDLIQGIACIRLSRDASLLLSVCLGETHEYNNHQLVMEYLLRYRKTFQTDIAAGKALSIPLDLSHLFVLWREISAARSKVSMVGLALDLSVSVIEITVRKSPDIADGLRDIIALWLKAADDTERTRQYVIEALEMNMLKENPTAEHLKKRYSTNIKEDDKDTKKTLWMTFGINN